MQKIQLLIQKIDQCEEEIERNILSYDQKKEQVAKDIQNIKKHVPFISHLILFSGLILFISPRARSRFIRFNNKLLILLLNMRLGMRIFPMIIKVVKKGRQLIANS